MGDLLTVLSILGVLAVVLHLGRALGRVVGRSAERIAAGQAREARARRGDLTGMAEASEWRKAAGRRRSRALVVAVLWLILLVVPAFTSWAGVIYAVYAVLWVVDAATGRLG